MGIIIIVVFLAIVGTAVFMVTSTMNKLKSEDGGSIADTKKMDNAQSYLPFVDIKDDVIDLGGFKYRAMIECTSTNYALKTPEERDTIEQAFMQFLNSLTHPVCIYIQTREVNYANILDTIEKDIVVTNETYPQLTEYAKVYYDEISGLKNTLANSKQKKKYIIVPYEDAIKMNELNKNEKEAHSISELEQRCSMITDNLGAMGIKGTRLNTKDIIGLIYSVYHRDDTSVIDEISNGDFTTDIVQGLTPAQKMDTLNKAIMILQKAESDIKFNVIDDRNPYEANNIFTAISNNIRDLKHGLTDVKAKGGLDTLLSDEELFNKAKSGEDENLIYIAGNELIEESDEKALETHPVLEEPVDVPQISSESFKSYKLNLDDDE